MNIIISQKLKNALTNKIFPLISQNVFDMLKLVINSITTDSPQLRYFNLISSLYSSLRETVKSSLVTLLESIDLDYKDSQDRRLHYYISKSNVSRTIVTIVGEISFHRTYYIDKCTGKGFFYLDSLLGLPKYDHYDPLVKGIAISNAFHTSQAQSSKITSAFISELSYFSDYHPVKDIPRQSIFNWINEWNVPDIIPDSVETPDSLFVMADEKFVGCQNLNKNLMLKSFVTFEDIKQIGKDRRQLVNRSVFSCYDSSAWPSFMDFIAKKYDFSKIKNIYLLGDGASWIKNGVGELKLHSTNNVNFYLCEFHFKQAIHHITTDKSERENLIQLVKMGTKKAFVNRVKQLIEENPKRKEMIQKKLTYLSNNYAAVKRMLALKFGSSMESHISHLIASFFASRPKGYSSNTIATYLKLNDFKNNGYNLFNIYLNSFSNVETITMDRKQLDFSHFDNASTTSIPILKRGEVTSTYNALHQLIF